MVPWGGVCGGDLGGVAVDPGGGGGGDVQGAGVILGPPDGLLPDALVLVCGGARQAGGVDHLHAPDVDILLCPEVHPGVEGLGPGGRLLEDGGDGVEDADLLGVRGGDHHRGPAGGKGGPRDRELAAGGPDGHLGGVLVLVLRQVINAPHVPGVELLELLQGPLGIPVGKGPHGLGGAVVGLEGQALGGRGPGEAEVHTVGRTLDAVVAGVLPIAPADGPAGGLAQVFPPGGRAHRHTGAGLQGGRAGQRDHETQDQSDRQKN